MPLPRGLVGVAEAGLVSVEGGLFSLLVVVVLELVMELVVELLLELLELLGEAAAVLLAVTVPVVVAVLVLSDAVVVWLIAVGERSYLAASAAKRSASRWCR